MDEYKSTYIALIQENLLKIRMKSLKISKIVTPLKIAKHYKLIRKIHLEHKLRKPIRKEAIYWATLENQTEQMSMNAFGDCVEEESPFIANVDGMKFHMKLSSECSVLTVRQMFVESSLISIEFYCTSALVNLLIYEDQLNYFRVDQPYSVSKRSICRSLESVVQIETNYELRLCQAQSIDNSEFSEQEKHIKNQYNSSMAIMSERSDQVFLSAYEDPLSWQEESLARLTILTPISDQNNHQSLRCGFQKSLQRNPLVTIESILDNSIIPHSWISLFQFSDFYLEIVICNLLEEVASKFDINRPKSRKFNRLVTPRQKSPIDFPLLARSMKSIGKQVSKTFVTNSIVILTSQRRIPSNATRSEKAGMGSTKDVTTKRSSANNNSDLKTKSSAVQSALIRRDHQMPAAMIRHYYNTDLRDHKRFVPLCSSMYLRQQIKLAGTSRSHHKKGRLERITIKGATDKSDRIAAGETRPDLLNRNSFDLGFMARLH